MRDQLDDDIVVIHTMGGIVEFVKKGTYHDSLKISSMKFDKTWYIKVKNENQKGSLRVDRKIVYKYTFGEDGFRVQKINDGKAISEWIQINVIEILQD